MSKFTEEQQLIIDEHWQIIDSELFDIVGRLDPKYNGDFQVTCFEHSFKVTEKVKVNQFDVYNFFRKKLKNANDSDIQFEYSIMHKSFIMGIYYLKSALKSENN